VELVDRRPEIDGLRAIAVLSVVFFHAESPYFSGGFIGVDIFFVISGYLIASIIISDKRNKCFSISNFYERRVRRILPALFVMIFVCIPIGWLLLLPRDMRDFTESAAATAIFISNHLFYNESGYFDTASYLKPLLHTWSLSVEVQYYLVFPIILLSLLAMGVRYVIPAISLIVVGSLITSEWLLNETPESAYFLIPGRLWEPLIGSLTALYINSSNVIYPGRLIRELGGAGINPNRGCTNNV
jgi:peptidoglycan/LPS O-acetylase OafA/YrhL